MKLQHCTIIGLGILFGLTGSAQAEDVWVRIANQDCQVLSDAALKDNEAVTWSGSCADGRVAGTGRLEWLVDGKLTGDYDGAMSDGRFSGKGLMRRQVEKGKGFDRLDGTFAMGDPISGDLNNDVQFRLNEDRKPLFEFDRTRITDQDLDGNPEYLPETSEAEKVPYIYYHNRTYINGSQWVRFKSNVMSVPWVQQQTVGIPLPYRSKTADPIMLGDGSTQPGFAEDKKFQIIAAGMDGIFGAQNGIYPDGILYTDHDRDNATNFIQGATLKDDIP